MSYLRFKFRQLVQRMWFLPAAFSGIAIVTIIIAYLLALYAPEELPFVMPAMRPMPSPAPPCAGPKPPWRSMTILPRSRPSRTGCGKAETAGLPGGLRKIGRLIPASRWSASLQAWSKNWV